MRRGTSEISLSSLEKQPGVRRSISYVDLARKSLRMLCGNPEGSHIEGSRVRAHLYTRVRVTLLLQEHHDPHSPRHMPLLLRRESLGFRKRACVRVCVCVCVCVCVGGSFICCIPSCRNACGMPTTFKRPQ